MQVEGNVLLAITFLVSFLLASFVTVEGGAIQRNNVSLDSSFSPWLKKVANHGHDPRAPGCWSRPWICRRAGREFPPRKRCCRNRCVDVFSDNNNCGWCGIRCPFAWKCCRGLCRNVNISPWNCGKCGNKCPFGVPCLFGICGYAQPFPPKPPKPKPKPKPPRPPRPFPPRPPKPKPKPPKGDQPPGMDESYVV